MDRNNAPGSSSSSRDRELYLSNLSNFLNSHQEPTVPGRIVQNLPEHSQDLPRSFNTGPGVHIAPAPSRNDGFPANSVAAHDAGTCGCESMNSINERLRKMARELKWDEATIEEHANNINQINRNTHPVGSEQPMTRRSAVDSQVLSQPGEFSLKL